MKKKTIAALGASVLLLGGLTGALTACSTTTYEAPTTTQATTKSSYNSGSYGSYGGSYNSGSKTTEKATYKQDDPYYRANDYDNDGSLSLDDFQGAVNDWMDDHDSYNSTTKKSYGSYNSGKTTEKATYKQDDPYYRANDYNNDGSLSLDEFQGAVNDWLDANGY